MSRDNAQLFVLVSYPSLEELKRALPQRYRHWVRSGLIASSLGYVLVALSRSDPLLSSVEFWIGVTCCALLAVERLRPKRAGQAALALIWWQLIWSLAANQEGLRSTSAVALPVWIVVVALFSGGRGAWWLTAITMAAIPLSAYLGWSLMHPHEPVVYALDVLLVTEMTILSAAWLVTQFMTTLVESVARDRLNASRTAQFIENAPDAMIGVADGNVLAFNALAERYFRVSRKRLLGQPIARLPFFDREVELLFEKAKTSPQILELDDYVLETRVQLLQHEGRSPEMLYVFRDVTERHAAERKAQELQVQLEHAQRLEAIGQLAGGIAHDFNNLLTAFAGTAELLLDTGDKEVRQLAIELEAACGRGAALTRGLLTFARRDVVQPRVLDLSQVLETSRTLLEHLLGERIDLHFDLTEGCFIEGDQAQLEQVVLNLATNARDAIAGSGTLSFRTETHQAQVRLVATDSGQGMDAATQAHIFEPFFTTKPRDKGTGLGLSTVHGIVTRNGGRIEVASAPGEGTTFTISFPRVSQVSIHHTLPPRISRKVPLFGHVLLAEDNDGARDVTRRLLERSGFQVTTANSGEEALTLCHDGLAPDILVSDVVMRGLSGVDLAERLRKKLPHLPVLFVSGYVDDVLRDWPLDTTQDLLLKPFSAEELISRVAHKLKQSIARLKVVPADSKASGDS